jgi:hypothetical protein
MNKIFLITILFLSIFFYGCSAPKGDSVCNTACLEKNFTGGTCQTLGSVEHPCEEKFNTTTIYSHDRYCDEYGKDQFSWFEWNIGRARIVGLGNMCCSS